MFTSSHCYQPEGEMEQNEVSRGHSSFNPSSIVEFAQQSFDYFSKLQFFLEREE